MINIGIGIGWAKAIYSVANNIIANFKARVATYPGSIFEAGPCLDATLEELNVIGLLDNASLIVTPNAYNEGKLYDVIPNTTLGDMDVVRATTATRVNSTGLIEVVPRNLNTYSEDFSNVIWSKLGTINVTANQTTAPDGNNTADLILGADSVSSISQIYNGSIGIVYTSSFFIKNNNSTQSALVIRSSITAVSSTLNWSGSVLNSITNTVGTSTFQNYGNGWYRIVSTYTSTEVTQRPRIVPTTSTNQSVYLWGAQLETFPTATEYFPTTTRLNIPRIDYTNGSCPSLLVEPQRTNLALYSEQFDNASWTTNGLNVIVSSNATTAPDGTSSADSILTTTTNGGHYVQQRTGSATAGVTYTMSVYVKKLGYDYCRIQTSNTATALGEFRFSTKTLNIFGADVVANSGKVTEMVDGWFRIQISILPPASATWRWWIVCLNDSAQDSFTGDITKGLYVWGFQFEVGSNATSYIPTVASTVTRNADVISKTGISGLIGQTEGTIFSEINFTASNLSDRTIVNLSDNTNNNWIFIRTSATVSNGIRFRIANSGSLQFDYNSPAISTGLHKVCLSYKLNNINVFIDGVKINNSITSTIPLTSKLNVGCMHDNSLQFNDRIKSALLFQIALTDQECIALTTL